MVETEIRIEKCQNCSKEFSWRLLYVRRGEFTKKAISCPYCMREVDILYTTGAVIVTKGV